MIKLKSASALILGVVMACTSIPSFAGFSDFIRVKSIETEPEETPAAFDPMDKAKNNSVKPYNVERLTIELMGGKRILIDEKPFIDGHGAIDEVSPISETGYVTYASLSYDEKSNSSVYLVKTVKPHTAEKAKVLGTLRRNPNYYHFQSSVNKEVYSGSGFFLGSKGILINKDNTAFTYIDDKGVAVTHALPRGYFVSPNQKGDLSFSNHLLILKDLGKDKALGMFSVQGVHQYDASLINVKTGVVTTTIKLRLNGKRESDRWLHLKSSFYLYGSSLGPIAVSIEDDNQKVVARNLVTNHKITLHERTGEIAFMKAGLDKKGKIWVKAADGMRDIYIDSVAAAF